ncbi:MAG: TRAP transporter small permease [Alphaproteobacteria bacterium]
MTGHAKTDRITSIAVIDLALLRVTGFSVAILVAAMVVVIWISVFTRYVMSDPVSWAEQVAKYLMIWATFLGASLGVRSGAHIAVDLIARMAPAGFSRLLAWLAGLLTAGFLILCVYYGVSFAIRVSGHSDPLVGEMSMAIPYAAIPVGCLAMLIQLVLKALLGSARPAGDDVASVV